MGLVSADPTAIPCSRSSRPFRRVVGIVAGNRACDGNVRGNGSAGGDDGGGGSLRTNDYGCAF